MTIPSEQTLAESANTAQQQGFWHYIFRGVRRQCPYCGQGKLFKRYINLLPFCGHCGGRYKELHADDAPPYITILIVGHIVVPLLLTWEQTAPSPVWMMACGASLLTLLLSLILLPVIKGGVVGVLAKLRSRGEDLPDQ